ncbi:MAG: DUF5916 domain-containing protein [Gemmatimonadota bacterium]|mgnify:FL=1
MSRNDLAVLVAVAAALLAAPATVRAQHSQATGHVSPPRVATAAARTSPIALDGRLDEDAWQATQPLGDFTQTQPNEGQPATQRTEIRILFDDDALYIGARMFDTEGAAGVRTRLVRRDASPDGFDYVQLTFDTFHDHLGRVAFAVNPSGVKGDWYGPGGANLDASWDAIWDVATRIDSLGWTAEFRIPFAQLRYPRDSVQTWGLQVWRQETRLNEVSSWSFWRLNEVGGPPRFGHLEGLRIAHGPGRAEILPYVVGRTTSDPFVASGDPFRSARQSDARVGADFKYLLTSNLTLSATVNPDFGQVEVDPAVVNLSAFETFFPERRPFFIEGRGLFEFGWMNCFFCSNVSNVGLFYPRRIGRQPQGARNAAAPGGYVDVPENTRILGAAKVTGRTGAWTVGLLDAVTAREHARLQDSLSVRSSVEVEPATNYFVGRLSRDLGGGSFIRGMATSVARDLGDPTLRTQLTSHSEAAGLETSLWWGRRTYRLMGYVAYAQVAGDSLALLRIQRSSARYFQRPDRGNGRNGLFSDRYDPSLTAMRGYAGYARLSREAGNWLGEVHTIVKSPGFEANDVAFNSQVDRLWMNGNVLRQFTRPTRFARQMVFIAGGQQSYNYDGDLVDRQLHASAGLTFHNYWDVRSYVIYRPHRLDDQLARGGPVLARPASQYWFLGVSTDSRKRVSLSAEPSFGCTDGFCDGSADIGLNLRPTSSVALSLGPSYNYDRSRSQWVTSVGDPTATAFYGRRYVFADLEARTLSMNTRLNVTFSPTLTLELFLQPLVSSGRYTNFKEYDRPRSTARSVYGVDKGTMARSAGTVTVDPDGTGAAAPFTFGDPDFNSRSLRGNAVVR